jgi:CMP-N,N'-diacetyllegionaminic acid synthase
MRVLAVVPARGGSRRVPRKNLAEVGGETLVRRALRTAVAASCFDVVALSTEDAEIAGEASGLDVVVLDRPPELATDDALAVDVVRHALGALEADGRFDAVAVVQATSPFTSPADLAGAVAMLHRTGAASVVSVVKVEAGLHPLKLKLLDGDRLLPYLEDDALAPSQLLPELWMRNGSVYVTRRDVVESGRLLDEQDVRAYVMPAERSLDIDTPRDLAFARFLLAHAPS